MTGKINQTYQRIINGDATVLSPICRPQQSRQFEDGHFARQATAPPSKLLGRVYAGRGLLLMMSISTLLKTYLPKQYEHL